MKTKEELLEEWKGDPKVSDKSLPELYRWQRAILMEGHLMCSLWREGSKEKTLKTFNKNERT
jgi:hypothetical protein